MMPEDIRKSLLKSIPDQKEKDMEIPRKESIPAATPDDRITALERRMRELEAMVKGLTDELLDLKSIAMRLNKVNEERRAELKMTRPASPGTSGTVVTPKRVIPPAPKAQPEPEKMDMIMQPDGTLKPERRVSSDYIVASGRYSKKGKQQAEGSGKKSDLIVAEDQDKDAAKK